MQKKDFDAQNLGFSSRKKILVHRISDFRAKKRFWCTESQIFEQKKDFHVQKVAGWEGNKGWANHWIKKRERIRIPIRSLLLDGYFFGCA